jgi:hypothetical protein
VSPESRARNGPVTSTSTRYPPTLSGIASFDSEVSCPFDPAEYIKPGKAGLKFNNFLKVFVESQPTEKDPVRARFMGFASGVGAPSDPGGSLVKVIRLVE